MLGLSAVPARGDFLAVTWAGDVLRIDPATGTYVVLGNSGYLDLNSMAVDRIGRFVVANNAGVELPRLFHVDPVHVSAAPFHLSFLNSIRALAFSPDGILYALDSMGGGVDNRLYTLDLSVGVGDSNIRHLVGNTTINSIQGMTFAPDGTLYAWSVGHGLIVIDPATAQATDVDGLIQSTSAIQTLAFTPGGALYGAGDRLFVIDRVTGVYTPVGTIDLPSVRGLEYFDPRLPFPFCEPSTDSSGCSGILFSQGTPSLTGPDDFVLSAGNLPSGELGFLVWNSAPRGIVIPDASICVRRPMIKSVARSTGGSASPPACPGALRFEFSQSLMSSQGLTPGSTVDAQVVHFDATQPRSLGRTNALRFTVGP